MTGNRYIRERISLPKGPAEEPVIDGECTSRECMNWPMYHFRTRACPPVPRAAPPPGATAADEGKETP